MLMELRGINNGQIELYNDKIIIKKNGAPDKTVYLNQISNVEVKTGSLLTNGYIRFSLSGKNESANSSSEITNASRNENTIFFMKRENQLALRMKTEIEQLK